MKDTIALKVLGFLEAEVVHEFGVRVKLTGKLGKLKKVCSKRMGVQVSRLRFRFKSQRIYDEDTPKALKMKDGDIIEVFTFDSVHKGDIKRSDTNEYILLKVVDFDEVIPVRKIHFNVKLTTQLGILKNTCSERMGVQVSSLRFVYKSHCIDDEDTPLTLKMKDGDIIGVFSLDTDWNNKVLYFKVKPSAKIDKLKRTFSQREGIPVCCLKFTFKGVHLNGNETPQSLEMKHGDIIEVSIGCIHGYHIEVTYTEMNRYIVLI